MVEDKKCHVNFEDEAIHEFSFGEWIRGWLGSVEAFQGLIHDDVNSWRKGVSTNPWLKEVGRDFFNKQSN